MRWLAASRSPWVATSYSPSVTQNSARWRCATASPASVCTPILARLTGRRMALELALFGDLVEAPRLYEMGLINQLADDADELAEVEADFVGRLAALDPNAVALTREMFRAAETMPLDNALDMGKHLNSFLSASGWFAEGGKKFAARQKDR